MNNHNYQNGSDEHITMDEFLSNSKDNQRTKPIQPSATIPKTPKTLKIPKDKSGKNNPFYGKKHTAQTRQQMSNSQLERYKTMRGIDEATVRQIIREELRKYL